MEAATSASAVDASMVGVLTALRKCLRGHISFCILSVCGQLVAFNIVRLNAWIALARCHAHARCSCQHEGAKIELWLHLGELSQRRVADAASRRTPQLAMPYHR